MRGWNPSCGGLRANHLSWDRRYGTQRGGSRPLGSQLLQSLGEGAHIREAVGGFLGERLVEHAKRGFVSHEPVDHTSITRLVELRFGLPALTARDANAWPLLDLLDFDHPDFTVPALPEATIDAARDAQCKADFPDGGR